MHNYLCNSDTEISFHILDINECLNNPCLNGGTCENVEGGYTCRCVAGWEGPECDTGKYTMQQFGLVTTRHIIR